MKLLVYDAEIKNAIPTKGEPKIEGIRYCAGWTDYEGMGISVICAYIFGTAGYRVFLEDNMEEFKRLAQDPETLLVGFNNRAFDDRLVQACLGLTFDERRSWDLLRAVRVARGMDPGYIAGGPNLDSLCKANFLPGKRGSGAFAPILWQQGKHGQVVDYCLNDVANTKMLVELVEAGRLRDHESGRILRVEMPVTVSG
jgi:Predicted 3'-5' exonuclease related to the exonuclease domain of PolB